MLLLATVELYIFDHETTGHIPVSLPFYLTTAGSCSCINIKDTHVSYVLLFLNSTANFILNMSLKSSCHYQMIILEFC